MFTLVLFQSKNGVFEYLDKWNMLFQKKKLADSNPQAFLFSLSFIGKISRQLPEDYHLSLSIGKHEAIWQFLL